MARMWNCFRVSLDLSHVERSTMFLWMNSSWTWVLIFQQQRKGNWDNNFVRNNILLSFPISWNLHWNVMHFGKETCQKWNIFILFWKTNVLHLYFFSFELNNGSRIPKEKIEQHYISPFLCIYLSLLATNYFAFMHHFIFLR